jgi:thiamine pyrophosphokinase
MSTVDRVIVVANGQFAHPARLLALLDAAGWVIAADGGANWLDAHGRVPQQVIGDMDSIAPALLERLLAGRCRVDRYPAHKDETDTELALAAAAALLPREILLLGALGGRIDHTLGNLSLLGMPLLQGIAMRIYDGLSYLWQVTERGTLEGAPGDLISLIPWGGDACGVTTQGLAYPLCGETLSFGPSRGISNVLLGSSGEVSLRRGQLLITHTPLADLEADDER